MFLFLNPNCDLDVPWHWHTPISVSSPGLAWPLLRSAARRRVASVECDDHDLDKAPHSWTPIPLWKLWNWEPWSQCECEGGHSPSTPLPVLSDRHRHMTASRCTSRASPAGFCFTTLIHVGHNADASCTLEGASRFELQLKAPCMFPSDTLCRTINLFIL